MAVMEIKLRSIDSRLYAQIAGQLENKKKVDLKIF